MNKDWKYILYLSALACLLLFVLLGKDKQYDWRVTLAHEDKNPYGTYALNELLSTNQKTEHRYKTFYELKDSLKQNENVLLLAERFSPDKDDSNAMLQYVRQGGVIFISANYISCKLADTLGIDTQDSFFQGSDYQSKDSTSLRLSNTRLNTTQLFFFRRDNIHHYLAPSDTSGLKIRPAKATVIARNHKGQAVAIRVNCGTGYFIFNSTPMIFTNIYLLSHENHQLISSLLSYLPQKRTYRSEFYQLGRMEIGTPLRFILTTEPLKWAYYIVIGSILLFILFEIKRKQRIIPIVRPLANTTLEFVDTIGSLYYENNDHKNMAMKKILFFNESLRVKFNFSTSMQSDNYAHTLSLRSGVDESIVQRLIDVIRSIQSQEKISGLELVKLNSAIQDFWNK